MSSYDLIVIGGGPAGYNAADYAAKKGMSVFLFEKKELGGTCLNVGCIPSKTFLNSAKIYNYVKHSESYGINVENKGCLSQSAVVERKNKVVKRLVTGVKARLKGAGVDVLKNNAVIAEKNENGFVVLSDDEKYFGKYILLATGSRPVIPNILGADGENVLTNENVFDLQNIPENLAVIGAGVIGLEMANYFAVAGSKVTVIEMLDKVAGNTEANVSGVLKKALEKLGVEFKLSAKVVEISDTGVTFEDAEGTHTIDADKVLLAIGRRPVTDNIGLENLGVEMKKGCIVTDAHMRTNIEGLFAAGDVNGKSMLAHTAYREGEVAVNNMLGNDDEMNYGAIPSVIYTTPEVAAVGMTESEGEDVGIDAKVVSISLMYSGRYIAENTDYTGICRLVYDAEKDTLIGAQIVGSYASEYIVALSNLIDLKVPVERIKQLVFPHPTVAEVIREAVFEI